MEAVRSAWDNAVSSWRSYLSEYRGDAANPPARRLLGRALALFGDWGEAVKTWEELPPPEKVAGAYLAEQARKRKK
jgi:hypothetical protein